jgi:uncharacterized protein (TIGR03118 family)
MKRTLTARLAWAGGLLAAAILAIPPVHAASVYVQTNLTSDIPGMAANTDANLKNPWGVSFGPTTPFWISDQGTNRTTLYSGAGVPAALVVSTPPAGVVPTGPTGQVFNSSSGYVLSNGNPALFIFSTLAGTIDAWNGGDGTNAELRATSVGSSYTGLATPANNANLYAANFGAARIDVYDPSFAATSLAGTFTDPTLPAGYSPYNIQFLNGSLYVEYAQVNTTTHRPQPGAGLGFVDVYNLDGTLNKRLISGGALNVPWGITMAPSTFGSFAGDLLVGNFGNGMINAFDPNTGAFVGTLSSASGPIVNSGLWALEFRTGGPGVNPDALYITAGINNEADGLFASIQVAPEPGTLAIMGLGLAFLAARARRLRR